MRCQKLGLECVPQTRKRGRPRSSTLTSDPAGAAAAPEPCSRNTAPRRVARRPSPSNSSAGSASPERSESPPPKKQPEIYMFADLPAGLPVFGRTKSLPPVPLVVPQLHTIDSSFLASLPLLERATSLPSPRPFSFSYAPPRPRSPMDISFDMVAEPTPDSLAAAVPSSCSESNCCDKYNGGGGYDGSGNSYGSYGDGGCGSHEGAVSPRRGINRFVSGRVLGAMVAADGERTAGLGVRVFRARETGTDADGGGAGSSSSYGYSTGQMKIVSIDEMEAVAVRAAAGTGTAPSAVTGAAMPAARALATFAVTSSRPPLLTQCRSFSLDMWRETGAGIGREIGTAPNDGTNGNSGAASPLAAPACREALFESSPWGSMGAADFAILG